MTQAKRLIDHVLDASFVPSRHSELLAGDASLLDALEERSDLTPLERRRVAWCLHFQLACNRGDSYGTALHYFTRVMRDPWAGWPSDLRDLQ